MVNEILYAVRQLKNNASFSATTILVMAVAIGVNAAVFTVVNAVLIRPLPFPDPDRVVVAGQVGKVAGALQPVSLPEARDWRSGAHTFADLAWWTMGSAPVTYGQHSSMLVVVDSSDNLFTMLGVRARLGRTYASGDDAASGQSSIVLSNKAWRELSSGDESILQQPLKIGTELYTVLGVMPDRFAFPLDQDPAMVWKILPPRRELEDPNLAVLSVGARLRPGASVAAAETELTSIRNGIYHQNREERIFVQGYRESLTTGVQHALTSLQVAAVALWLIACANVAGLFMTRLVGRRREIAVRRALGASTIQILRQFLWESSLTAGIAACLGFALSQTCLSLLRSYVVTHVPFGDDVRLDPTVLGALVLLSLLSALVFGVVPAWYVSRSVKSEVLRDGTARAGVSGKQGLLRDSLAVVEITCTLALLMAAGLLLRSLHSLRSVALGFAPDHLIMAPILVPQQQYGGKDVPSSLYEPLLRDIEQTPGVTSAAFAGLLPLSGPSSATLPVEIMGQPPLGSKDTAEFRIVSPALYTTLSAKVLQGRTFTEADSAGAPFVAVVNRSFVKRYLPNQDALGQRIRTDTEGPQQFATVVGVIEDMPQRSLTESPEPEVDLSYKQKPALASMLAFFGQIAVRTSLPPEQLIPSIRQVLERRDPELAKLGIRSYNGIIDQSLENQTLLTKLLWIFGSAGLMISTAGLYALLAHNVARRRQEIGVRMAMGAMGSHVLAIVMRRAAVIILAGIAGGLMVSAAAGQAIRAFLFGVGAYDLLTISVVTVILAVVAASASLIPARRAMRTDPATALKCE